MDGINTEGGRQAGRYSLSCGNKRKTDEPPQGNFKHAIHAKHVLFAFHYSRQPGHSTREDNAGVHNAGPPNLVHEDNTNVRIRERAVGTLTKEANHTCCSKETTTDKTGTTTLADLPHFLTCM